MSEPWRVVVTAERNNLFLIVKKHCQFHFRQNTNSKANSKYKYKGKGLGKPHRNNFALTSRDGDSCPQNTTASKSRPF